ncbi:MAG: SPFH domain-containing protein [Planctomycetaceae bacterium]|nr:SPFH domain-containing protein [Planctomycetaceae bacterium]
MFGIRYLKVAPTTYVLHYKAGRLKQEGPGLSFFYFGPTSEIVLVPMESTDVPFLFSEVTSDFQDVTIQGQLTYRIVSAKRVAEVLNFSVDERSRYRSEDPQRLAERLSQAAQIAARSFTQQRPLKEVLVSSDALVAEMTTSLKASPAVSMLGVEVLGLSVLAIKPTPEMAKALQADAREQLLKQADEAIYARRNSAVDMERTIKENELKTEIAVEEKKRQVRETQMAAEIAVEEQRARLVDERVENERKEADARAHALAVTLEPLKQIDWKILMAAGGGTDPKLNIALAFRELAENAQKIGELNVSPDLLANLIKTK